MKKYLLLATAITLGACSGSDGGSDRSGGPANSLSGSNAGSSPSGLQTGVSGGGGSGSGGGVGEDTYGSNASRQNAGCPPGQVLVVSSSATSGGQRYSPSGMSTGVSSGGGSGSGGGTGEDTVGGSRDYACAPAGTTGNAATRTPARYSPSGMSTGVTGGGGSGSGGGTGEDTVGGSRGATMP